MAKKVGFIGLGIMGGPMARRLAVKYGALSVFDLDPSKIARIESDHAHPACDVAAVGSQSEVVVLSLPSSAAVKQVILGDAGLAGAMSPGTLVIDTSTTEPAVTVEVADGLRARRIAFLDAPVSGGERAAIDGTLSIMVGGDEQVLQECTELLRALGTTVVRVGGTGMGQVAKLVNNMIVGATFAIVAEGFALGVKCGVDPRVLYEAIHNGWAGSRVMEVSVPAMLERNFTPGGTVNIHWKDLSYALALAREHDVPTPLTALVHEIFKAARASGDGALSQPAIVMLWERLLGVQVRDSR